MVAENAEVETATNNVGAFICLACADDSCLPIVVFSFSISAYSNVLAWMRECAVKTRVWTRSF